MAEISYTLLNPKQNRTPSSYLKHPFLCLIFFSSIAILLYLSDMKHFIGEATIPIWYKQHYGTNEESFAIRTKGCTIPGMKPLSEEVKAFVYYPEDMKKCLDSKDPLLMSNETHIWTDNLEHYKVTDKQKFKCCYQGFYRPKAVSDVYDSLVDHRVEYKGCIDFTDAIEAKDEFVKVTCSYMDNIYVQFFTFAVTKNIKNQAKINDSTYNVIVLGIDGVSRLNVHRTMPKMISYLEENGAVELMGYNVVGKNSYNNIIPMLTGYHGTEIKRICHPFDHSQYDACPFVWNLFKELGYHTAFGEDSSPMGTFTYQEAGFLREPTDYYPHTFLHEMSRMRGLKPQNPGFTHQLCMHDKYFYKVLLDYVEHLTHLPIRLFGFFWEVTMTHDYLNYPMVMDTHYVEMLERLKKSQYLDETILLIVSDHGMRYGYIRSTKQGYFEMRLPFVFVLTPPSFRKKYKEAYNNLKLNGHRLTTPFDVHAMMSDIANLESVNDDSIISRSKQSYGERREISLFLPIPSNRTCKMAEIADDWCTCQSNVKMSPTDKEIVIGAQKLKTLLNKILKNNTQCEHLSVSDIVVGNEIKWKGLKKQEHRDYRIIIRTKPGNGEFEATIRKTKDKWSFVTYEMLKSIPCV